MSELPSAIERFVPGFARPMTRWIWRILAMRPVQFVLAAIVGFLLTATVVPQVHFLLDAYKHGGLF